MNRVRSVVVPSVLILVLAASGAATGASTPGLPEHSWGVYAWGGSGRDTTPPADMPIRGIPIGWRWPQIEPVRGKFNFEESVHRPLEQLRERNLYTHIMLWVARTVTLTGSGEWREIAVTLADAIWDHRLAGGADLALRHVSGADAVFHLLELARK